MIKLNLVNKPLKIIGILTIIVFIYVALSWYLLGKITYLTGEFESDKHIAKKNGFFVCDVNVYKTDSITRKILLENKVNFWLSKRTEIKYYGFLLHRDLRNMKARTLIIDGQSNSLLYSTFADSTSTYGIPNSIECEKGDTIRIFINLLGDISNKHQVEIVISE